MARSPKATVCGYRSRPPNRIPLNRVPPVDEDTDDPGWLDAFRGQLARTGLMLETTSEPPDETHIAICRTRASLHAVVVGADGRVLFDPARIVRNGTKLDEHAVAYRLRREQFVDRWGAPPAGSFARGRGDLRRETVL
jgi:hypothetical protein